MNIRESQKAMHSVVGVRPTTVAWWETTTKERERQRGEQVFQDRNDGEGRERWRPTRGVGSWWADGRARVEWVGREEKDKWNSRAGEYEPVCTDTEANVMERTKNVYINVRV